jgi:hypothetical protein
MKLVRVKTEASSKTETVYKKLNATNMIQDVCLLDSQILMLMEETGHSVYFARNFWLR